MPTREQTTDPWDRADIRFYGSWKEVGISQLALDLGQYETDLSIGAGNDVVYEAASTRFDFQVPRTLAFHVDAPASNSVLWLRDVGGLNSSLSRVGTALRYVVNGSTVINLAYTGTELIVVLRTEVNVEATGASDAHVSTLEIYDVSGAALVRDRATHEAEGGTLANTFFGASSTAGGLSWFDARGDIFTIRFSSRAVPFTEIAQDWIASLPDPTSVAKLVRQGLPLTEASGIGDVGEFHGPAVQHASAELRHAQWRTMGTLCNWRFRNVLTMFESSPTSTTHREKLKLAPGGDVGTGFRLRLGWFGVFPVHPLTNALWVQVHARCVNATDADLRRFGFRLYSFNRKPVLGEVLAVPGEEEEPLDYRYAEATFTADENLPGSWRLQQVMPVVVGQSGISKGMTYLGLAYAIDLDDESTESLQLTVRSMHAVEMFNTTVGIPPGGGPPGESG